MEDAPYTLDTAEEQQRRPGMLTLPHMKPLTDYVVALRDNLGEHYHIPNFDPCDGGVHARVLFLLEAPGPKASKFASSNNPDPTAKNLWNLIHDAGIARADTLIWNIVPWYVGTGKHILPVNSADIRQALPYLEELLALLPNLQMIVLVGRKAQLAKPQICLLTSRPIRHTYHMSALVFNRSPEKKKQTEEAFSAIAREISENKQTITGGDSIMPIVIQTPQEIVQRGIEIYEQRLRAQVEGGNQGKFLVINTETGDYEMDANDVIAAKRAKSRFGDAPLFSMRVGHTVAYRLGSRKVVKPL